MFHLSRQLHYFLLIVFQFFPNIPTSKEQFWASPSLPFDYLFFDIQNQFFKANGKKMFVRKEVHYSFQQISLSFSHKYRQQLWERIFL